MSVINIKWRIAIAAVLVLLSGLLIWAFWGTLQYRENVEGILVRTGRITNIYSPEERILLDISIRPGDFVSKDQVIARIEQPELIGRINAMLLEKQPAQQIKMLREELIAKSQIIAPESGRVLEVFAQRGDYLKKGTKIAVLSANALKDKNLECLLYIPFDKIKLIKKGMQVHIYPDFAKREEYGGMTGMVAFVSEYPVTFQHVYDLVGNEALAEALLKNNTCYEIAVSLATSEETATGYKWTTSLGPPKKIGNLSLCDTAIVVQELRPVDVFSLRKK